MCENCGGAHASASGTGATIATDVGADQPIVANVSPGFEAHINVRLLPAKNIELGHAKGACRPRAGAVRHDVEPLDLPEDLVDRLREANTAMVAWLAKDADNPRRYLDDPVAALAEAGVELSRAHVVSLTRSHRAVREQAVVPPGAAISGLSVVAAKRGKVGDHGPVKGASKPDTPTTPTSDCDS